MVCGCCSNVNCGGCNVFKRPLPHVEPCYTQAYSASCVDRPAGYFALLEEDVPCTCENAAVEACSHPNFALYDIPQIYKDSGCVCSLRQSQCNRCNCNTEYDEFGTTVTRHDVITLTKYRSFIYVFDNVACVWRKILEAPPTISFPGTGTFPLEGNTAVPPDCTPPDCGESFPAIDCTCVNPLP